MLSETQLVGVIAAVYEAGLDFNRWPDALERLAHAFGGHAAGMARQGPTPEECWGVNAGIEPAFEQSYVEHYHGVNPVWRRSASAPAGTVLTDSMVVRRPELTRTEFFQDFLHPQAIGGMLTAIALVEEGRQTVVTVHASRDWNDEHIALYRLLAPHLQRALEINVKLARAEVGGAAAEIILGRLDQGVVFVTVEAQVVFANRTAEDLLMAGDGLRQSERVLQAASAAETAALHSAIAGCAGQGLVAGRDRFLSIARGQRAPLAIRIAPAPEAPLPWVVGRPVAILCVTDPEREVAPPSEELRSRFGLTPAQAALALEILRGDGIQAAADRLSITRATARSHLAQIFQKTGAQRQSELVRLLLSARGSMRAD